MACCPRNGRDHAIIRVEGPIQLSLQRRRRRVLFLAGIFAILNLARGNVHDHLGPLGEVAGRFLRGALSVMHWKMAAFGDTFNPSQDRSFFKLTHYRRLLSLLRSPSDPDWSAFRSQWRHYRFHVRRESHSKFMIESMSHASDGSRMQFHLKRSCSRTQPSTSATCYGATCLATSCPCGPRRRCRSIRWDCGP